MQRVLIRAEKQFRNKTRCKNTYVINKQPSKKKTIRGKEYSTVKKTRDRRLENTDQKKNRRHLEKAKNRAKTPLFKTQYKRTVHVRVSGLETGDRTRETARGGGDGSGWNWRRQGRGSNRGRKQRCIAASQD